MNSDFINEKKELLQWISELQDEETILEILKIKNDFESLVKESKSEYIVADDFEERWAKGLTSEQSRAETKRRINEWWGK
ncbi:hypothetical protein [Epilithonimonas xixisoli]|uniref:Uncharacterized protein n=1 Tax=Epilithonimonas xixisoli TaxID=1476462 RepID=A0A4R8IIV5_9FLAO|nr:hypothetical protein [Epilithonimonas xixisoli]TDX86775.1 hypothetical protein B0I22_0925 [Epilithonimonas xixisoli]